MPSATTGVAATPERAGRILVLAGVNGAGKSSVLGAALRATGSDYYNPDELASALHVSTPHLSMHECNARAWTLGYATLQQAVTQRLSFAVETTLGGASIPDLLATAGGLGIAVHVRFIGLRSPELHLARVRARVAAGGHDIPEAIIRARYGSSPRNLIRLLPWLTDLELFDNSANVPSSEGRRPVPAPILQVRTGALVYVMAPSDIPAWAMPIVAAASAAANE